MRICIFVLAVILCSCGSVKPIKEFKEVKGHDRAKKKLRTGQVFLVVAGFMIGYCVTGEYFLEK